MANSHWPEPWYDDPWQIAIALLYAAMAITLAAVLLPSGWWPGTDKGGVYTLMGAIATVTTGVIALWLGLKGQLDTKRQAQLHARLLAVEAVAVLAFDRAALDQILTKSKLESTKDARQSADYFIMGLTQHDFSGLSVEVLATLSALSESNALKIALAYRVIADVRRSSTEAGQVTDKYRVRWLLLVGLWTQKLAQVTSQIRGCEGFLADQFLDAK